MEQQQKLQQWTKKNAHNERDKLSTKSQLKEMHEDTCDGMRFRNIDGFERIYIFYNVYVYKIIHIRLNIVLCVWCSRSWFWNKMALHWRFVAYCQFAIKFDIHFSCQSPLRAHIYLCLFVYYMSTYNIFFICIYIIFERALVDALSSINCYFDDPNQFYIYIYTCFHIFNSVRMKNV